LAHLRTRSYQLHVAARPRSARTWATLLAISCLAAAATLAIGPERANSTPPSACDPPVTSVVACENSKPGDPASEWQITGDGDPSIQGFASPFSIDHGQTVHLKVKTDAADYRIDVYRLGYYGGLGARKVATLTPSAALPQTQPDCVSDASTGLVDCGNWAESVAWDVPTTAVSGVYLAKLVRADTGGDSHIFFVVRDDERRSELLFQTSDTTWQAYNRYGGNSLYVGSPDGRAYKVSYNRPFTTRAHTNTSFLFNGEYPMIRWIERNGYDVSYFGGVDTAQRGGEILEHDTFLSVGHDEYWSNEQRTNVEAARDAGVNLAFFSGNEMFWKTRWESSIDGTGTPYKTLVSYKETKPAAKIDPNPAWTGTWRDKRFSPPSDGGRPENALTGTLFTVNSYREDAMVVPASDGQMRFWRNTSVESLAPGASATFPAGILGHEWDEDVDNGVRPAGLFHLSTTTRTVSTHLVDEGNTFTNGTATHSLTLYQHASGALVFGAGTVQWAWGLDNTHDIFSGNPPRDPDARMQQATVNLFADMGAQPATLQADLAPASASTDAFAPTSTITAPAPGIVVRSGTIVTISGTASDAGGGRVGGVEVSADGGETWHPAAGREAWTYAWVAGGDGIANIRSRAVDDSGNIETPAAGVTIEVACPCKLWASMMAPTNPTSSDSGSVELGVKFRADTDGWVTGLRFYKGTLNTGTHVGSLWTSGGALLTRATFTSETGSGWQEVQFDAPITVTAGATYVASYHAPNGHYAVDLLYFSSTGYHNSPLHALANGAQGGNGVYAYGEGALFPNSSYSASNYWVDVVFYDRQPVDTKRPTVVSTAPAAGATDADSRGIVTATFSEAMNPASVNASTFLLRDGGGAAVAATVTYDAQARRAALAPTSPLAYEAPYTAIVKGGSTGMKDAAGNSLSADVVFSFTTAPMRTCPCTIWSASATPATASTSDARAVELGVRFRSELAGYVTGIRFYKGARNTGSHTGSFWTNGGALLARVTFTGETASGWQEARFDGPVAITPNTTYIASYHAPDGGYALTSAAFAAAAIDNAPLHALRDGTDGANGIFRYSTTPAFPNDTYNAGNYWVDVIYESTPPADTSPPRVTAVSPAAGATGISTTAETSATFSELLDPATLNAGTFQLRDDTGALVAAQVAYSTSSQTATLHPATPLDYGGTYTATLKGGAGQITDATGNPLLADYSWTFTVKSCPCTIWSASATPATASAADGSSVELGVKFRADVAGTALGIRFYKGSANTGTHDGSLWAADGTLLARGTFTGETPSGWQEMRFAVPVSLVAGDTYIASYHAPNGGYSLNLFYFGAAPFVSAPLQALANDTPGGNGIYLYSPAPAFPSQTYGSSNYWVDVLFQPS
jgi:N,N-dimethylformamidase beta subunit-like protein/uncharacterized protein DUF4082/Big-like domain-containing protein